MLLALMFRARAAIVLIVAGIALAAALPRASAQALQPVPALTAHVMDSTGTLNDAQRQALEAKLAAFEQARGAQVVLLMVPTTPVSYTHLRAHETDSYLV